MVSSNRQFGKKDQRPDIVGALRDRVIGNSQIANRRIGPDPSWSFVNEVSSEFHAAPSIANDEASPESSQPPQRAKSNTTESIPDIAALKRSPALTSSVHHNRRPSVLKRALHSVGYGFFAIAFFGVLTLYSDEHFGPEADAARSSLLVEPPAAAIQAQEAQLEGQVGAVRQIVEKLAARQSRLEQEISQLQAAEQQKISQLAAEQQELSKLQAAELQAISQLEAPQTRRHRLIRR